MVFPFILKLTLVVVLCTLTQTTIADREHKVHNIVLYPERHSWCQTTAIKQIVASPGYEPITIDNNVCVGACFSYSIPRTQPAEPGELIGPYCDSCQPAETMCYHVTLRADNKNFEGPKTIKKRVEIIMNCSCISCTKVQNKDCEITDQNTSELPTDLFSILHPNATNTSLENVQQTADEIPELIHISNRNRSESSVKKFQSLNATKEEIAEHNQKLINLLKSIQKEEENEDEEDDTNINYDKTQLKELLEILEHHKQELSSVNLMEHVNFINVHNSEDLQLDLTRLKEVLYEFLKTKDLAQKHKNFGLGFDVTTKNKNEDINKDIEDLTKQYSLPSNFGLEGNRAGLTYHKGNHVAMGIENNVVNHPNTLGRHHYAGQEQHVGLDTGHLVVGPRGSLVLAPDSKTNEKLHLDNDMIKPNHEGVVISYENHPKQHNIANDLIED